MTTASITRQQAQELLNFCKEHKLENWFFAKDDGVYFGATTGNTKDKTFKNCIQYVKGFDPNKDDYYEEARYKFGGDDLGEFLPVSWLELYFNDPHFEKKRTFGISLNKKSISLTS